LERFGAWRLKGSCPYMSSRGGLPSGKRRFSIHCAGRDCLVTRGGTVCYSLKYE
jgi:hypothetical protein